MAAVTRNAISRFLEKTIKEVFRKNLQEQDKLYYPGLCSKRTSNKKFERYDTVGNISAASEKPEGTGIKYQTFTQAYQTVIENKTYATGIQFTMEAADDDLYGIVDTAKTSQLMRAINARKEKMVAGLYNDAFTAVGADGVAYIANNHPLVNSAAVNDNLATGAFTPDNYIAAYNKFSNIKDQAGELFDTRPTKLVTHIHMQFRVAEILNSALKALELSNTKNVLPAINCRWSPYLSYNAATGQYPWFLIDETIDPFILQERKGVKITVTQDDKDTLDFFANVYERYGVGIITPGYGVVGSQG
jgi:phage major head subunit gpT-like protein